MRDSSLSGVVLRRRDKERAARCSWAALSCQGIMRGNDYSTFKLMLSYKRYGLLVSSWPVAGYDTAK